MRFERTCERRIDLPGPLILHKGTCYHIKVQAAAMNERDNQAFNPLPPLRDVDAGYQFDTSPNRAESPYLSFPGTTPPQASDNYSPDSPEAVKYASTSAKKWRDTRDACKESPMNRNDALDLSEDAIMNTSHLFDEAAGFDLDAVDDST
eukprot:scaffold37652_cov155-Skeletonema_dohrnii-CCMP3373.AAC.1